LLPLAETVKIPEKKTKQEIDRLETGGKK